MNRHRSLAPLSRDHHHALALRGSRQKRVDVRSSGRRSRVIGVIAPERPHHVELDDEARFFVRFSKRSSQSSRRRPTTGAYIFTRVRRHRDLSYSRIEKSPTIAPRINVYDLMITAREAVPSSEVS